MVRMDFPYWLKWMLRKRTAKD